MSIHSFITCPTKQTFAMDIISLGSGVIDLFLPHPLRNARHRWERERQRERPLWGSR